ncbi:MAG TPA: transcription termination/antitermination protein NusG [Actinomycetota bacterium]|nr:transcription termination/antitermination protein NusG [Actinomycetota bacterium]
MNGSPENQMDDHAPKESQEGAEPVEAEAVEPVDAVGAAEPLEAEAVEPATVEAEESLEDQVAQALADAAVQEAIADGAIEQALEETVAEDIEAAASLERASDAAIQEAYEEKVVEAVAEGLEGDALADAVAQAAADADVQEAIADAAIEQALEETIAEDIQAAEVVEAVSDEGIVEDLEERMTELVAASEAAEPPPGEPEPEAPVAPAEAEDAEVATAVRDPFRGPGEWYVVHTYAGYENKVKTNLESRIHTMQMEDKIFDVHVPMEDVMEIKGGKKQIVQRKVFPGYLLVKMTYDNDSWYVVRNTPGVTGFVAAGTGSKPTPLSRREVEKILAVKKEEVKPAFRLGFEEGDVVRIISGPFADFNGTISEINVDQSKLKVLVNIFDRETPVELGFDQVAKV